MIAGYNHNITTVLFPDQAGDDTLGILRAPAGGCTLKGVYVMASTAVTASTADYYTLTLQNGGTVGTATLAVGTALGTVGIAADTGVAFTLNSALTNMAAGEYLKVLYDETGTVAPGEISIIVEWVQGQG